MNLFNQKRPDFTAKDFQGSEDYESIASWWSSHGFEPMPLEYLPREGLVVWKDDVPAASGFLYPSPGTKICYMVWILSNPQLPAITRGKAIDHLLDSLILKARGLGCKFVFTSSNHDGLNKKMQTKGFHVTENPACNMLMRL